VTDARRRQTLLWPQHPVVAGLDFNEATQLAFLDGDLSKYVVDFDYPDHRPQHASDTAFFTSNGEFEWLDARVLFAMLRSLRPRRMIEIGSGYTSLLTADVNRRFLDGRLELTCIEPYPRDFLKLGVPGIRELIDKRVQDIHPNFFRSLNAGDILFVDSSHVSKTGSDVNYIIFEILPRLTRGVIVHFHDIFLPHDYPKDWVLDLGRSWNEQFLVRALLMQPSAYEIMFGAAFAHYAFFEHMAQLFGHTCPGGASLWLRKTAPPSDSAFRLGAKS
jgi:hypothetical protein